MLNTEIPLVSVLMTAYNREQFIAEAIESVLVSTFQNFELIIVDDGSKDNTVNIAKSYAEKDSRIKVYINEKNLGDYPNRNRAASYAGGEYIMYVDSDDTTRADTITYCIQQMLENPLAEMLMIYLAEKIINPVLIQSPASIKKHFFEKPFLMMGPGGTFIKKSFFDRLNGYPVLYGPANDMYFNLKAAYKGSILLVPYIFVNYRRHEGQEINNKYSYIIHNYNYLEDAITNMDLPLTKKEKRYLQLKNKRRFVTNLFRHLLKTRNITEVKNAIKQTKFGIIDIIQGLFHL